MRFANILAFCRAPLFASLCATLSMIAAGTAVAGEHTAPTKEAPPAVLYHNYCSVCHGDKGDGRSRAQGSLNPPPRDFTAPPAATELTRARIIHSIKEGRPGTAMVPWKGQLSDKQVEALADYIRESFMGAPAPQGAGRGRQLYAANCSVCHGDRGASSAWASSNLKPAPRDFTAPAAKSDLSRERMIAAVTNGRPGTAMVAFASQLSKEDIALTVDYIRTAFMQAGSDAGISGTSAQGALTPLAATPTGATATANLHGAGAVIADMSLPLPNGLKGDAAKGRTFYLNNCATCHGTKGDGQGPRAYFINPKPRNFVADASRAILSRPAIYAAVSAGRLGTEMPAWDKVLTPQEIANVSEFVFQTFIRTAARDKLSQGRK